MSLGQGRGKLPGRERWTDAIPQTDGGAAALAGAGFPGLAFAASNQKWVTVVKISGIPLVIR